jgi:Carboxypeptidase regulatory-like domain
VSTTRPFVRLAVCLAAFVLGVLGACLPMWAQNVGSLRGTVTDKTGAAVPDAIVIVTDLATNALRTTKTDNTGTFGFAQVSPATYKVEVAKDGFKKWVEARVTVLVATPTTLEVRLELGTMNQQVIVESAAEPALNTQDATVGNPFAEDEVKSLPFLARNVVNLLTLQPGVVTTGNSNTDQLAMGSIETLDPRDGAVDGVRGNQTNITVDGIDANDWQNQAAFTSALPITLDSVQEFRVTTTNANATDGIVGGAQVALVTKGGTNDFHGNLRWYYRTSGPSSNDFFNNEPPGIPRGKDQRNIGGGSLGGPIKKKRAFFFVDNEDRREVVSAPAPTRNVPTNTLKDGVLVYQCADAGACPASTVTGLSGQTYQIAAGNFGLPPTSNTGASVLSLDPQGKGVNPAMIPYMALFPAGNLPEAGFDGGLSFSGFNFNSALPTKGNLYTARVDYNLTQDGRQSIFVRGSLEGLSTGLLTPQFPGQPSASTLLNNSRGIAVNYNAQLSSTLINSLRYGLTRIGVNLSGASGDSFDVRSFSDIIDFGARADLRVVPVHQVSDDVTWTRGKHTLSFGAGLYFVRNRNANAINSFPAFDANNGFCINLCSDSLPNGTNAPLPNNPTAYIRAFMMLTGSITQVNATFFATPQGQFLPAGSLEKRDFAENLFEPYVQDSWKVRSNLTVTLGLRYGYETPPWEVNGFQVAPTINIMQYFIQREKNMEAGISSSASPLLSWGLAGKGNHDAPSWFYPNYLDFAPRLALAYSPNFDNDWARKLFGNANESVIRLGAGIFYDRVGQALAVDADQNGSPGTATALIDGSQQFSLATAPRFSGTCSSTGCTGLPAAAEPFFAPPTSASFPFTPVANASNLGFAVDPNLQTPYTIHLTASFQRQLPKGVVLDIAYVGTLGRRLLGKADFAQYLDLTDPASKTDLFTAYRQVAKLAQASPSSSGAAIDPTNFAQLATIQPVQYFTDLLPNMPKFDAATLCNPSAANFAACQAGYSALTPTQAFYAFTTIKSGAVFGGAASWSCALFALDTAPFPGGPPTPWNATLDPTNSGFVLFPQQFAQLDAWTNFANSNYNSVQVTLKKTVPYGSFAFNYVFSKSIDNASAAENGDLLSPNVSNGTANGLIQNPFDLRLNRAVSDFNLKHNFTGSAVIDLPFGRGHRWGGESSWWMNALIGGWEVTSAMRWHSGFPQSPSNGFNFPTNFFLTTDGQLLAPLKTSVTRNVGKVDSNGNAVLPNLFSNPAAALADITFTLPGLPGSRNVLTGPAYASLDMGINKSFRVTEHQRLQIRVTAFNVFNSVNFSDNTLSLDPTSPATFGQFTGTASQGQAFGRQVEFAVRYDF